MAVVLTVVDYATGTGWGRSSRGTAVTFAMLAIICWSFAGRTEKS